MRGWLSLLGMARRAGALALGEEAAARAALDHKARVILVAADAGDTTQSRARRLEQDHLPVLSVPAGREELGGAVGFASVAVLAVCDLGFAAGVLEKLASEDPGAQRAAALLAARQNKAMRRKADTRKYGRKSAGGRQT